MRRQVLLVGYGAIAYLAFLVVLGYAIGFLAGTGDVVPKGVDDGVTGPAWLAVLIDVGLLGLFAAQHSVMARPWFKRWWTRVVPPAVERSTYVLVASLVLAVVLWQWRPLPDVLWSVEAGWLRVLLWMLQGAGWGLLVLSTFLIGHLDLFGLRQVFDRARRNAYTEPGFAEPPLYRLVRHPMMVGFFVAFWATPDMSAGRLLFVGAATAYIVVAVRFEEHDLRRHLGEPYERYAERVPRFVPRPRSLGRRQAPLGATRAH